VTVGTTGTTQRLSDVAARQVPSGLNPSGLKYDGGPANPVPYAKGDNGQFGSTLAPATGLPVSFNKAKSASPYTFKAYGEK
jgi:hypothetical protein